MTRPALMRFLGLVCLVTLLGGCGEGGAKPDLYPAGGTVTYKGEAVDGATVSFRCDEANTVATGTTDAQGHFELNTYKVGKGAVAGKHEVTVSKVSAPGGAAPGEMSMEDSMKQAPPAAPAEQEDLLPTKYADAARPLLEFTVSAEGQNDFKIELAD